MTDVAHPPKPAATSAAEPTDTDADDVGPIDGETPLDDDQAAAEPLETRRK